MQVGREPKKYRAILSSALVRKSMYLVVIAWVYVVLMMSVAEAFAPNGTLLGAIVTFVLYGAAPIALVVYLMSTPARNRARKARLAAELALQPAPAPSSSPPDASSPAASQSSGQLAEKPPGACDRAPDA
jgi:hypothetical protein